MAQKESRTAIEVNIEYIKRDITAIGEKLDNLPGVYLTQREHAEFVLATEKRFKELEQSKSIFGYVTPIASYLIGAVSLFFVLNYFQNLK